MGKFLKHGPCPNPQCGSSDAYAIYEHEEGRLQGKCWSCGYYEYNIDGENNHEEEPKFMEPIEPTNIEQISTVAAIPDRGLDVEFLDKFGIRVSFDEVTGEIDRHFYPYYRNGRIVAYKVRNVGDKDFRIIGDGKNLPLFGEHLAGQGGQLLIITEGELDAIAAVQMLAKRGKSYRVVSLPSGANAKAIRDNIEWLETFENIFLSLDQDDPGMVASKAISELITPGKVKVMSYSEKDACDMLKAGKEAEYFNSIFNAQPYRPDGIVSVDDIFEEAIKPVEQGLSWPWPKLTDATYGYRRGELYGFGAGSGCGKTEGFKEIIHHCIYYHKLPVGVIFLEEPVAKTLKVIAGKEKNKRFHIPNDNYSTEEMADAINELRGKVYLYNHYGAKDWDNIKAKIKYMVLSLGIKDIFLDHLTALVAQEADEYKALNRIMEEMSSLTQELDCTIFYISHLRKASGTPHEEGGHVSADQFKGSGAIVFWSNFLFGYERNQQADEYAQRNTTTFRVLKDRNTGLSTGYTFELWYDHDTGRYREKTEEDGLPDTEDLL